MKKLFLLVALPLLFAGAMMAQEDTKMWAGGSLGYNSVSTNFMGSTFGQSFFFISPEFGYHLNSDWAVGGRLDFGFQTDKGGDNKETSNSITFAPFARYSLIKAGDLSVFGQGEIPIVFGDAPNTFGIRALPGVNYSLSSNINIQALLPSILAIETGDDVTMFKFLSGNALLGLMIKF